MGKKGVSFGLILEMIPATLFFLVLLVVFGLIFFAWDIAKSPDLTIKSNFFDDSGSLLIILRTPLQDSKSVVADLIVNNPSSEDIKKIDELVRLMISQLPKPENKNAFWNFIAVKDSTEFLSIRESSIGASNFKEQTVYLPMKDKSLIKVSLFLNCACNKEDIEGI